MSVTFNMQSPVQTLTLGDISVTVERYQLKLECPVAKQMLCSGEPRWTVLGMMPCILSIQGRIAAEEAAALLETLRTALNLHSAFSFTFLGTQFQQMQLTAMDYHCDDAAQLTDYALSFVGMLGTGGDT